MTIPFEGGACIDKGLPPLPSMLDALAVHTQSLRVDDGSKAGTPTGSVKSRRSKSKRKMKEVDRSRPIPPTLSTDITPPYSSQGSPATPTPTRTIPFTPVSLDSTRSFTIGYDPKNPLGSAYPPSSPSVASRHSASVSTTPKSSNKFSFGTKSSSKSAAPSVHSSHTMPEMIAYNDVDQWGVPITPVTPTRKVSQRQGSAISTGLRRKNSSSKLLASGLSRSLTRMGSVMKRSTSSDALGSSMSSKKEKWKQKRSRRSIVVDEMGEGWERVDMDRELTEGDAAITRPFNVEHDLHVSPDLGDLPPAWLDALKAQGLSEADLLLIAAARHKAAQRPLLRIVKDSALPVNEGTQHHHARGMSTPAYLVDAGAPGSTPLLNKRFSWERNSPATPTNPRKDAKSTGGEQPISPFRAFRQSLQDSPVSARTLTRTPSPQRESDDEQPEERTPRKIRRWSDQLRGFQNSLSTLGADDDWGSQLTLALTGEGSLQEVQEVDSGRGESMETTRSESGSSPSAGVSSPKVEASNQTTPRSDRKNTKSLHIHTSKSMKVKPMTSPLSPISPGGTRIRRKPVPDNIGILPPSPRRTSSSDHLPTPPSPAERPWPHTPPPPLRRDKPSTPRSRGHPSREPISPRQPQSSAPPSCYSQSHSHTQSVAQSNESELSHEVHTPSTVQHPFHSPHSSLSHPMLPRSISEETQFPTLGVSAGAGQTNVSDVEEGEGLSSFSFPSKSPPRPDPRHSVPASAGYTESVPPSRAPSPSYDESASENPHTVPPQAQSHAQTGGTLPITPPQSKRSSSRRVKPGSSPSSLGRVDPMSRLDGATTMTERASIALSLISAESDVRSSMASSARSSYLNEAKVLRAYTRDLSGVEEGTSERESVSESDSTQQHGSTESGSAYFETNSEGSHARPERSPHSYASRAGSTRSSSRRQRPSPSKTPPGPPPICPHPFASRKDSSPGHETEDDPLHALEAAARHFAKRTEAHRGVDYDRRESGQGKYSDAEE